MLNLSKIRMFRYSVILLLLLGACAVPRPEQPNVLFIMVDDLRTQLGCYGQQEVISPHIDRLAGEGFLFSNAYCNIPVCGASRASIFSGMRGTPSRFVHWYTRLDEDAPQAISLPAHFVANGYTTRSLGKVFHHRDDCAGDWSQEPWWPKPEYGMSLTRSYLNRANRELAISSGDGHASFYEKAEGTDAKYPDEMLADKAVEQLRELSEKPQPFFLAVGFLKPHLPFLAPAKYWEYYNPSGEMLAANPHRPENAPEEAFYGLDQLDGRTAPVTEEEYYDTYPTKELRRYHGIPDTGPIHDTTAIKLVHGYYASVSFIDDMIGRVLAALEELDLKENTIVLLLGDHGWHLGEHGLWCKHCNFKNVLQTPLLIRVPWIDKGKRIEGLAEFIDLYPTLCELCGLDPPARLEGESLVTMLEDPGDSVKKAVFLRFMGGNTVKTSRYAYTEWYDRDQNFRAGMLYDHLVDPEENLNIAGQPEHQERVREFRELILTAWPELEKEP
jgi:arylsulfatase A-like enzyme